LEGVNEKIIEILKDKKIKELAEQYAKTKTFFFVGRRQNLCTAQEGALKLKEICYVHAEAYPAGELKHGPLALMDDKVAVMAVVSDDDLREKVESNIQEIEARSANVVRIGCDQLVDIPKIDPRLAPILNIVPLHLFAYYISDLKGLNPDKPRNLAKSVTVE